METLSMNPVAAQLASLTAGPSTATSMSPSQQDNYQATVTGFDRSAKRSAFTFRRRFNAFIGWAVLRLCVLFAALTLGSLITLAEPDAPWVRLAEQLLHRARLK